MLLNTQEAAKRAGVSESTFYRRFKPKLLQHIASDGTVVYESDELDALMALSPLQRDPVGIVNVQGAASLIVADIMAGMRGEDGVALYRLTGRELEKHVGNFPSSAAATLWALQSELAIFAFLGGYDTPKIRELLAEQHERLVAASKSDDSLAFAIAEGGEVVIVNGPYTPAPRLAFGLTERRGHTILTMTRNPSDIHSAVDEYLGCAE